MNDVLNFKSITTYRVALPLKFEFKTAKGTVRVREVSSFVSRINKAMLDTGNVSLSQTLFYTAETVDSAWKQLVDTYILELRLMRPKPLIATLILILLLLLDGMGKISQ